jgi:hypothetical protein
MYVLPRSLCDGTIHLPSFCLIRLVAAIAEDGEFAKWARPILLKAAEEWHATQSGRARKPERANEAKKEKAVNAP